MSINFSLKQLETTIVEAVPSFPPEIANLVMEYSHFPSTEGWITEWTGETGHRIVTRHVREGIAETSARRMPGFVKLIVDFLQKSEIFTRKHLEEMVGGSDALKRLLPEAGPEHLLPFDIDEEMQRDLGRIFSPYALNLEGIEEGYEITAQKVTELYCLFWLPKDMTACLAEMIARNAPTNKMQFLKTEHTCEEAIQRFGHIPATEDGWILFPRDVIARWNEYLNARLHVPKGFEISSFCQAVYCNLMFFHLTGQDIFTVPDTFAMCREEILIRGRSYQVEVAMRDGGLSVERDTAPQEGEGIAAVRFLGY